MPFVMNNPRGSGGALIIVGFLGILLLQMLNAILATALDLWPGSEGEPALNIKALFIILLAESGLCFSLNMAGFQQAKGSAFLVILGVFTATACLANFLWLALLM